MDYAIFQNYKRWKYIRECLQRIVDKIDEYLRDLEAEIDAFEKKGGR